MKVIVEDFHSLQRQESFSCTNSTGVANGDQHKLSYHTVQIGGGIRGSENMGCDIHSVGQIYRGGKWHTKLMRVAEDVRSYHSFAILANVRNGYGVAGCTTGDEWPYISEPRGLPHDLELENDDHHGTWMGDHSHSWLLLSEIEEFVKTKLPERYRRNVVVTYEKAKAFIERGVEPDEWCGGIIGKDISTITEDEFRKGAKGTHVEISWYVSPFNAASYLEKVITELRYLASDEGVSHDHVRFVFGFDN